LRDELFASAVADGGLDAAAAKDAEYYNDDVARELLFKGDMSFDQFEERVPFKVALAKLSPDQLAKVKAQVGRYNRLLDAEAGVIKSNPESLLYPTLELFPYDRAVEVLKKDDLNEYDDEYIKRVQLYNKPKREMNLMLITRRMKRKTDFV
jgi:hypothetical protein